MGFMDKAKDAAGEHADKLGDHSDKVDGAIDSGSDFVNDKTGGKYSEHIDNAGDQAREHMDGLSGQGEDAADDAKNKFGQNK